MYLIELFLHTYDNTGKPSPKVAFSGLRQQLAERFGGVTPFLRAPAVGLWSDDSGELRRDDLAIFEVMADSLDREWWGTYRAQLEQRFRQDEIVTRASSFER